MKEVIEDKERRTKEQRGSIVKDLSSVPKLKRQKTTTKQSGRALRVEPERRTARDVIGEICLMILMKIVE
jgi:hypothetical protein